MQQSDLKTPYGRDSVMAGSKNFGLQIEFHVNQCFDYLCTRRVVTSCSLHSSCHGDVDAEQITE